MSGDRTDFFISHAGADRAWAEWVAWELKAAGYTVELDIWDWAAGQNFIMKMNDAMARTDRVLALFSPAYFERTRYTAGEWSASLVQVADADDGRLVPVWVERLAPEHVPPVLRHLIARDLSGLTEEQARRVLLESVEGPQPATAKPAFPGQEPQGSLAARPRLPGTVPGTWNLPPRNPGFTGRGKLLVAVREALLSGDRAIVQALHGLGGVGKTQLAIEYAHRFAGGYDLVWWINAEEPALVGVQLAQLAQELGCAGPGADPDAATSALLNELRQRGNWLLVFDNAADPADLRDLLPGGAGHVLITSRNWNWAELAVSVEVGMLARAESVLLMTSRVPGLARADAVRLSAVLGDLPLALAQAAAYMAGTGTAAADYLALLGERAAQLMDLGQPGSHSQSLTAVTRIGLGQLHARNPAAAETVAVCAYLAPEPVPARWFPPASGQLPGALADKVTDPVAWGQVLDHVKREALCRLDKHGLLMHRLTQVIVRDSLDAAQASAARSAAEEVVARAHPGDTDSPGNWPLWASLVPHLLAIGPQHSSNRHLRATACDAARYLIARGDTRTGRELAENIYHGWHELDGPGDPSVMAAGICLALALRELSEYRDARRLSEQILSDCRRVLGDDHPDTLLVASGLAGVMTRLGDYQAAQPLEEETLERRRRVLGDDHPHTFESMNNLAVCRKKLGDLPGALELEEEILARRRRVLGNDHPRTIQSMANLAVTLSILGNPPQAYELDKEALDGFRRVLGSNHRHTLTQASNLAEDLRDLGNAEEARELDEHALHGLRRILGEDHFYTLIVANNLAEDLRMLNDGAAARELDEDTLARCRRVLGENHPDTLKSARNLAKDLKMLEAPGPAN